MKRFFILMALIGSTSTFAKTPTDAQLANHLEQQFQQQITNRKQDLEDIEDCAELKLRLVGIISALSADAKSLEADAIGSADPARIDEIAVVYRRMMPLEADSLSVSLTKLSDAIKQCE